MEIIPLISSSIKKAQARDIEYAVLYENKYKEEHKNEFLFFIKPEITLDNQKIKLESILDLIFDKIKTHHFSVKNVRILAADYLEKHKIISQHYGVINQLSGNAEKNLSREAIQKFEDLFETDFKSSKVLGSLELIQQYPSFSPTALDYLWQNSRFEKLSGGTYCAHLKFDGEELFLINGFHPRQLEHFIQPGRSIIAMTLTSDTDWDKARQNFIGATNPASAMEGSIRKELFNKHEIFGLKAVTASWNGVHLSAGPVEGLVELIRYNSDLTTGNKLNYTHFSFGKKLMQNFQEETIEQIIQNSTVLIDGEPVSVFDATEEKNSDEAIEILRNAEYRI